MTMHDARWYVEGEPARVAMPRVDPSPDSSNVEGYAARAFRSAGNEVAGRGGKGNEVLGAQTDGVVARFKRSNVSGRIAVACGDTVREEVREENATSGRVGAGVKPAAASSLREMGPYLSSSEYVREDDLCRVWSTVYANLSLYEKFCLRSRMDRAVVGPNLRDWDWVCPACPRTGSDFREGWVGEG
ncbi:hypothetical protein PENSPDRAFT_694152 [Peniophora sp. CONT]|nr:hypothetical protein PENSPDRAFT_694152 [Peniophora sp. CONT]